MVAFLACVAGCVDIDKIKVTSAKIDSVTPKGLKSVSGTASVGVSNGTKEFTVSEIGGKIYRQGTEIGTFSADPVTVLGNTDSTYEVNAHLDISGNVSIVEIISIASNFKAEEYTTDFTAKFKVKGGVSKTIEMENVPLKQLVNMFKSAK